MPTPVELPKLGNTVEECIVSKWRKRPGDPVAADEIVAEIETDKATFEVPSPVAGTLLAAFFAEGALVPVFTNLFVVGAPGEDPEPFRPQSGSSPAAQSPHAETPAVQTAPAAKEGSGKLSPRARRFASERDFHPPNLPGSGPGGRVLEADIKHAYFLRDSHADSPHEPAKISGIREKIARRMRESLASTAQYTLHASAGATGLLALRARFKAAGSATNINDLVAFCAVKALAELPDLNTHFIDGRIVTHDAVHLGFACDTPRGLMVPVVRDAHSLGVDQLAARMKELTAQALAGKLSPDDLSGATFTISNLGGLGIESFTPLLNPPQVAILGVGAIVIKPVRQGQSIELTDVIGLSLTCDHQVIDGAPGARFLAIVRNKIETVETLCTI